MLWRPAILRGGAHNHQCKYALVLYNVFKPALNPFERAQRFLDSIRGYLYMQGRFDSRYSILYIMQAGNAHFYIGDAVHPIIEIEIKVTILNPDIGCHVHRLAGSWRK
jgi:hypothetical protein